MSSTATETVMRITRIASHTGAAALLLAGYAGIAKAQSTETHVLTLRLPNGQIEQVRYAGDVPPTVVLAPTAMPSAFDPVDPFAMFDRMAAAMDRQAEAMIRTINAMTVPNAQGFGVVPAMSGPGVCMRSVQITYPGNGQAPHVVSHTAGDCGPAQGQATPTALPNAPAPKSSPNVVEAKAEPAYTNLLHSVGDWQR
jgi:hypothetical protein